jgi:hypothetical protein
MENYSQFAVDGEVEQREIAAAALKPLRKPSLAFQWLRVYFCV